MNDKITIVTAFFQLNRENWNINESERNTINRKVSEKSEEFHQLCDLIKKE